MKHLYVCVLMIDVYLEKKKRLNDVELKSAS